MKKIWYLFAVLKPEKAIFLHIALWFGILQNYQEVHNTWAFSLSLISFLLFYGGIYAMNDIADYKLDRRNPDDNTRLIASGRISRNAVWSFIIPLWIVTFVVMYLYSSNLAKVSLLLLVINVIYSWFLKAIPYIDILFISLTQPIKYFVALYLCESVLTNSKTIISLLLVIYFIAVLLHSEKQIGKMVNGAKRHFIVGNYSQKVLANGLGNISLILACIFAALTFGNPEFFVSVLTIIFGISMRYFFSKRDFIANVNRMERLFQPH